MELIIRQYPRMDGEVAVMEMAGRRTMLVGDGVGLAPSALMWGFLLAILQVLDGVLTTLGMQRFGLSAEGNPFLRQLMEEFGCVPALAITKSAAICIVITLTFLSIERAWIQKAMSVVSGIYLAAAIIPWTFELFIRPLVY